MSKEEAIKLLNMLYVRADITDEYGDMEDMTPYEEAINMAIKALEQEPILDKIRAEIEGLQTYCLYSYTDLIERHEVFEIIDKYRESEDKE
jgi:hypothetical protein